MSRNRIAARWIGNTSRSLGSAASADVTGCVIELEAGKIMIEDGWPEGPVIDKGPRWNPADVGDAVDKLLKKRAEPRKVWGT